MKEERMTVLKMIESGKITPEEGERLLNALKGGFETNKFTENMESAFSKCVTGLNELTKDFGVKLDEVSKEMEPKFKKTAKIIADKTASTVEEISKTFKGNKEECTCDDPDCPFCNPVCDDDGEVEGEEDGKTLL